MLGIAGIAVFFAVGLVVSVRLLGLSRRSRRLPELLAGLGLLGIGPLGFCVMMAGVMLFRGTPLGGRLPRHGHRSPGARLRGVAPSSRGASSGRARAGRARWRPRSASVCW